MGAGAWGAFSLSMEETLKFRDSPKKKLLMAKVQIRSKVRYRFIPLSGYRIISKNKNNWRIRVNARSLYSVIIIRVYQKNCELRDKLVLRIRNSYTSYLIIHHHLHRTLIDVSVGALSMSKPIFCETS